MLGAATAADIMAELDLTVKRDRFVHVQACSAKTGEGLQEGIETLLKEVEAKKNNA